MNNPNTMILISIAIIILMFIVLCIIATIAENNMTTIGKVLTDQYKPNYYYCDKEGGTIPLLTKFYHNGKNIPTNEYIIKRVDGKGLEKRGIINNELIFIKPCNKNIKPKDVVFTNNGTPQLSECLHIDEDNITTFIYRGNKPNRKLTTYKRNDIIGVAKYSFKYP